MKQIKFVNLHCHSQYSFLDGVASVDDYISKIKSDSFYDSILCITDHGNLCGAMEAYVKAKQNNLKFLFGFEAYIKLSDKLTYHTTLLAKNYKGYLNLLKLHNYGWRHFYYKPLIDEEFLFENASDLIVTSACIGGDIPQAIDLDAGDYIEKKVAKLKEVFGENYFFELMLYNVPRQIKTNNKLLELSKQFDIKCIITTDSHYVNPEDVKAQEALIAIQRNQKIGNSKLFTDYKDLYVRNLDQFLESYIICKENGLELSENKLLEFINNTSEVANECEQFEFDVSTKLPNVKISLKEIEQILLNAITENYEYKLFGVEDLEKYNERLEYEFSILKQMKFLRYFYVVYDIMRFCRDNDIMVGPCRGSVGGSLVAYLLDITKLDPIKYDLMFERFINKNRKDYPDIDIDFEDTKRDTVKEYLREKYGNVADIMTVSSLASRGVLRDLGRVFDLDDRLVDMTCKSIFSSESLNDAKVNHNEIKIFAKNYPEIWNIAKKLEGKPRHISKHAAGIVIAPQNIDEVIPIVVKNKIELTGWPESEGTHEISRIGLLKFDILGLSNLTIIKDTLKLIDKDIDLNLIDIDDKRVIEQFAKGNTKGIFQFESRGITDLLMKLRPTKFDHLVMANALYRPGPLSSGFVDEFIILKNSARREQNGILDGILGDTFGIPIYQEQVMKIASKFLGIDYHEADNWRRFVTKDTQDKQAIEKRRKEFIEKSIFDKEITLKVWNTIVNFVNYSFNKAHSTGYALLAYWDMWLKVYYPREYMVSLLSNTSYSDKRELYLIDCIKSHISILGVDINKSKKDFSIDGTSIRLGFSLLKGCGDKVADAIVSNQPYDDVNDFQKKLKGKRVSKTITEALVDLGAFGGKPTKFDKIDLGRSIISQIYGV
ncbi:DNA polymerase III subunit alpha [Candidatus Pacearchaeota archaeon]|nr:DNA polymerase III subunit alpha [Candidatus Pacearchaeota archaeon]